MRLLGTNILVKQDEAAEKTASGLYIPDTGKKKPNRGTIVEVGPGLKEEPMEVKPGNRIQYGTFSGGVEIEHNGEMHIIMRQSDIQAVISEE